MGAATVIYEGSIQDTGSIITAMSTIAASEFIFIPIGPNGLLIMRQGS